MNKLLEYLKSLFELSDEQVAKVEDMVDEVKKEEKTEVKDEKKEVKDEKEEVKDEKRDTKKEENKQPEGVQSQSGSTSNEEVKESEDKVDKAEFEKLQKELASMKKLLEDTNAARAAEKRSAKIKAVKDCQDYDVLSSLLNGVEDKDIDSKVEEIKKDKAYLFKSEATEGFNPASPDGGMSGVEAAFYELNPSLRK